MSWGKATIEPSQITDLVFLGSNRHGENLAMENPSGIKAVLNVGSRRQYEQADSIEYKRVPLEDAGPVSLNDFKACIEFIRAHVDQGNKILVHCNAGRNRSTAMVIGFLLAAGEFMDWQEAFNHVKFKRDCVQCHSKVRESVIDNLKAFSSGFVLSG
jgi:protein-tyrosine phosphatase